MKISSHCFTNALIQVLDLPEDEYTVVSCEIFSPGRDVKSMDILLKGKKGYINIEFHKRPLSKAMLDRNLEYIVNCYISYDAPLDQKILIIDDNRTSVKKIQIIPGFEYEGNYHYFPDIDGREVLNNIINKIENNEEPTEYEQYIFSVLPLTNHGYGDEGELMEKLCNLTPELNISEKNREAIALCQMILIDLYVESDIKKKELLGVITMTMSYIEKYENELKDELENEYKDEIENERKRADEAESLLKEIAENENVNDDTKKKIMTLTAK